MILNTISLPYKTKRPINEIALEGEQQVDYRNDYRMKSSQTPFNKAPKKQLYNEIVTNSIQQSTQTII